MPKGIPLTEETLDHRRRQIFAAAAQLFVEKGFPETSMREIAETAGVGKSTLYDYFPAKEDILIAFVVEEVRQLTARAEEILALELSAADKLRRILRQHLDYMLANKLLFMKISFEAQRLSLESQQRIQTHRHAYQDMLCNLLQDGIRTGEFRPVNPLLAARSLLALLSSAVYTTRPTGSADEMMLEALDILFKGIEA